MLEPSNNSGSTPTPQEVGNPTDSRGIRSDLNRWVGLASGVVSTIGVATAWGETHFPMLVGLWVVIGMASGVLGQLWQRPDEHVQQSSDDGGQGQARAGRGPLLSQHGRAQATRRWTEIELTARQLARAFAGGRILITGIRRHGVGLLGGLLQGAV